jgi:hypothetical protein
MIDQLRTKVSAEEIPVVLGDMRTSRADGVFDLVFLVFNGISNILTQEAQIAVAQCQCHLGEHWVLGQRTCLAGLNNHRWTLHRPKVTGRR